MGMVKEKFTEYEIGLESMEDWFEVDDPRSQNLQGLHWNGLRFVVLDFFEVDEVLFHI